MKTVLPAIGMSALSALIMGGALYLAVDNASTDATASEVSDHATPQQVAMVFDESPAVDPVKHDETAEAIVWKPHDIPKNRENVRRVGARFYPDPDNKLNLMLTGF